MMGVLAVLGHTARRTCRRTNPRKRPKEMENGFASQRRRGKIGIWTTRNTQTLDRPAQERTRLGSRGSCRPQAAISALQPNDWYMGNGATGWAVDSAGEAGAVAGAVPCRCRHSSKLPVPYGSDACAGGTKQLPGAAHHQLVPLPVLGRTHEGHVDSI